MSAVEELYETQGEISVRHAKYFFACIGGLIALFTLSNWIQITFNVYASRDTTFARTIAVVARPIRRVSKGFKIGNFLILPGRIALAVAYFAINLTLLFTDLDLSDMYNFCANRCGWMAISNLALVVFLGLKNTPLSPLAGRSYDSINVLHRCCGYTTIVLMLLHASCEINYLVKSHQVFYLEDPSKYAAIVAAFSLLTIGFTGFSYIRKRQYELFVVVHLLLIAVVLSMVAYHVYDITKTAFIIVLVAAGMWFADRSLRFSRWIYHGFGNYATLIPLADGATKVVMRCPIAAQPGSHAFLYIPAVRKFQTHPFTLIANSPAEFIISAQDGFTKDLHMLALKAPNATYRAAIEGPYGHVPDTDAFDKTVLIGGGSGITFTMALAMDWLRKHGSNPEKKLDFIWSVKTKDAFGWCNAELHELAHSPQVNLKLHVTQNKVLKSEISSPIQTPGLEDSERQLGVTTVDEASKELPTTLTNHVEYGRPNVDVLVLQAIQDMPRDSRVLIAGSGPSQMLDGTRLATTTILNKEAPSVKLHLEQFEW